MNEEIWGPYTLIAFTPTRVRGIQTFWHLWRGGW
jgi:hypothetical protein